MFKLDSFKNLITFLFLEMFVVILIYQSDYMKNKPIFCGCGYGKPISLEETRHIVGEGNCRRMIAKGIYIPTNFRMELWTHHGGTEHEKTFLTEVCDVSGYTITKYTLTEQRLYSYKEEDNLWTMPKDCDSMNSIDF